LAQLSRAPERHIQRHGAHLHQLVRELRASSRRACDHGAAHNTRQLGALNRRALAAQAEVDRAKAALDRDLETLIRAREASISRRRRDLERLALALQAHDPQRTLERGYALVQDQAGELIPSATAAREAGRVRLRFHDGVAPAVVGDKTDT